MTEKGGRARTACMRSHPFAACIRAIANCVTAAMMVVVTLVFASTIVVSRAQANGWEHAAVPLPVLLDALNFDDTTTRAKAAESLGVRGAVEAVPPLLTLLEKAEQPPEVKQAVYRSLGQLGDPAARDVLLSCLSEEVARLEIAGTCVTALGHLASANDQPSFEVLSALAQDTVANALMRARAVDALALSGANAVPSLTALLKDPAPGLSLRAVFALGRSGAAEAARPLVALLKKELNAEAQPRRLAPLVAALRPLGAAEAGPVFEQILQEYSDPALRVETAASLAAIGTGRQRERLERLLTDPIPAVQYAGLQGLRDLADPEAGSAIAKFAKESFGHYRSLFLDKDGDAALENPAAAIALASVFEYALRTLGELAPDGKAELFSTVAAVVPEKRKGAAGAALANAVYQIRRAALYMLGYTKQDAAMLTLIGPHGLADPDPRLRAVAMRSIGVLGDDLDAPDAVPDAVAVSVEGLQDPSAEVRWTAATVLGLLNAGGGEAVLKMLADTDSRVRAAAAEALGLMRYDPAKAALLALVEGDDADRVQQAARFALSLIQR